jgi:hypothetical protein
MFASLTYPDDQHGNHTPERVAPSSEVVNGQDDDCDGLVDEDFVSANEVIITELMVTPGAADAPAGQWIEIRNDTSRTVDLSGWTVSSPVGAFRVPKGVRLSGQQRKVLGFEGDPAKNGGVSVDVVLEGDPRALPVQGFYLALSVDGRVVNVVADFKWPAVPGASVGADPLILDPAESSTATAWCAATTEMANGDFGTPGAENDICPQFDHDGDGYSGLEGDCDDTRADIGPLSIDVWDHLDNDCDGTTDLMVVPGGVSGQIRGTAESLGRDVEVGDWNGDGVVEAMIVGGSGATRAYRVPASALLSDAASRVGDVALGLVQESTGSGQRGAITGVAPPFDPDGDGDLDLVVLGRAANFYSGSTRFDYLWVYDDLPESVTAPLSNSSALIIVSDPADGVSSDGVEALVSLDLDGDGKFDPVFGHGSYKGSISNNDPTCNGKVWVLDLDGLVGRLSPTDVDRAAWVGERNSTSVGDALAGGDVNDDGYDDVVVMDLDKQRQLTSRRVQVIPGGDTLPSATTVESVTPLTITGLTRTGQFWNDIWAPVLADIDADGTQDLAVPDPGGLGVAVFFDVATLSGEVPATNADLAISGPGGFGTELAWGDVDSDGQGDLLVGAPTNNNTPNGRAYLFSQAVLIPGAGLTSSAAWASFGSGSSATFGARARLFDVDGDSDHEVLIPDAGSFSGDGALFVFRAP